VRINGDCIARLPVARLKIEDVERWHARLRYEGLADVSIRNLHGVLRAALTQAVRWGWVSRNVASLAELTSRKVKQRSVMSAGDVRRLVVTSAFARSTAPGPTSEDQRTES
jgi:integrase